MKRIQFTLRDIFLIVLYCMLALSAAGSAWALKLARSDMLGATVAGILIVIAIIVGAWIGASAGGFPTVKRFATSAIVTCLLVFTYAVASLIINRSQ
jgi:hypothetical protein